VLGGAKLVAFVATTEPQRSIAFYRDTLGLRLVEESPIANVLDANGAMVRAQVVDQASVPRA
jgi:catechol 2,3-dioxygenase-like lactoylglutathione lyase family enzyme